MAFIKRANRDSDRATKPESVQQYRARKQLAYLQANAPRLRREFWARKAGESSQ